MSLYNTLKNDQNFLVKFLAFSKRCLYFSKSKKSGSDSKKHSNEELSKTPVNTHPNPDDSIKPDRSKEQKVRHHFIS